MSDMIGIDLVFIPEFKKQLQIGGKVFLDKAFTMVEQKDTRAEHLAGLWAAKEAVVKASGMKVGRWSEISISRQTSGGLSTKVNDQDYDVSISHHGDYAVAVAIRSSDE